MKKIAQWITGLQLWIKKTFDKAFARLLKLAPIAIRLTEGLKKFLESPVDDLILAFIQGEADEALRDKVQHEWLPKISVALAILYGISTESSTPAELLAKVQEKLILLQGGNVPMGPEWAKISAKILEVIADGKVTWNELTIATQLIHYEMFIKPNQA
jgi:hypothetical protein